MANLFITTLSHKNHLLNNKIYPELTDEGFNKQLPEYLQNIAKVHFTPLIVAISATDWLTQDGKKNILDIGAGVGKFCIAGAAHSDSVFTGIEHRPSLVKLANSLIDYYGIHNAKVLEKNLLYYKFDAFNAFYMYNPFYENLVHNKRLNNEVPLSVMLHRNYIDHTREELKRTEPGTRVVTYHGENLEIPSVFEKVKESFDGLLKFWIRK